MDRGNEEILASASTTIVDHQNGSVGGPFMSSGTAGGGSSGLQSYPVSPSNNYIGGVHGSHILGTAASISHSDSSETSLHSGNNSKVGLNLDGNLFYMRLMDVLRCICR